MTINLLDDYFSNYLQMRFEDILEPALEKKLRIHMDNDLWEILFQGLGDRIFYNGSTIVRDSLGRRMPTFLELPN